MPDAQCASLQTLSESERAHLRACQGWLELGEYSEALRELNRVPRSMAGHFEILRLRYQIYSALGQWDWAYLVSETAVQLWSSMSESWLWRAHAARCLPSGGLERARELLQPAVERFPEDALIPLNLALFESQLGHVVEAREWLHVAGERGKRQGILTQITSFIASDPALAKLWKEKRR